MRYSQDINISKINCTKHELLKYYTEFNQIISSLNISPIQLILKISLANKEIFEFSNIDDFKNQISELDEILSVTLTVLCGLRDAHYISLHSSSYYSSIKISSIDKAWVDDIMFKYQSKRLESIDNSCTTYNSQKINSIKCWIESHKEWIIGILGIVVTIIISILNRKK